MSLAATPPSLPDVKPARPRWLLLCLCLAFVAAFWRMSQQPAPAPFFVPQLAMPQASPSGQSPSGRSPANGGPAAAPERQPGGFFQSGFLPNPGPREAHSASMVALPDGRMRAFWMDGNEGSRDAVIATSVFDPAAGVWSPSQRVTGPLEDRRPLMRHLRKVGNAIAHRADDGRLWLFYVTVSVGGWAGSALNARYSLDDGKTWSEPRRIITSPFLNLSTLVRHQAVRYADGTFGLPVYHELMNLFAMIARFDQQGALIDLQRINDRHLALQATVLVRDESQALVYMRNGTGVIPRKAYTTATRDGGRSWLPTQESQLPNPGTPLAGLVLDDGVMLLAMNRAEVRRRNMSLMISADAGGNWREVHAFENHAFLSSGRIEQPRYLELIHNDALKAGLTDEQAGQAARYAADVRCTSPTSCDFEYSYPFLARATNGDIYLMYTWNRSYIRWARFDRAWIQAELLQRAQIQ